MPPRPGQGQPLLRVADGGVDPSVENHLHPSASPVRELPGDFVLTICVHRESSMGNGKQFSGWTTLLGHARGATGAMGGNGGAW